jgi:riboflavin synthase
LETKFVIHKWSIALNGVSLTVVNTTKNTITVSLIPLTQEWTNLWKLTLGQSINIEYDMIAKYVANMIPSSISL